MSDKRKRAARAVMAETGMSYAAALREAGRRHAEARTGSEDTGPDLAGVRCPHCLDDGHVCEDHPDYPWAVKVEGHDGEACGGAGMPCPRCCSEIPADGSTSIAVAFVPDWRRA